MDDFTERLLSDSLAREVSEKIRGSEETSQDQG